MKQSFFHKKAMFWENIGSCLIWFRACSVEILLAKLRKKKHFLVQHFVPQFWRIFNFTSCEIYVPTKNIWKEKKKYILNFKTLLVALQLLIQCSKQMWHAIALLPHYNNCHCIFGHDNLILMTTLHLNENKLYYIKKIHYIKFDINLSLVHVVVSWRWYLN